MRVSRSLKASFYLLILLYAVCLLSTVGLAKFVETVQTSLSSLTHQAKLTDPIVEDIFGRPVNHTGLILVDWEGYIANPAVQFRVKPPPGTAFPASAHLTATGARLYFDRPSTVGPDGPAKTITLANTTPVPVHLAIFPDRDMKADRYSLTIRLQDAWGRSRTTVVPIHILDQDRVRSPHFNVTLDFSPDRSGLFDDPLPRAIVQQATADWAYFIDEMELDRVPTRAEQTWLFERNGTFGQLLKHNPRSYTGFLLYAVGMQTEDGRSRGYAMGDTFQTSHHHRLPLRRSGGIGMDVTDETQAADRWLFSTEDDAWWQSDNSRCLGAVDFYSVASHEVAHALAFSPSYPVFAQAEAAGSLHDTDLGAYYGTGLYVDPSSHFTQAVDPASLRGAFGNHYAGQMPPRRWLITKLDLLAMQAIGYRLRPTSPFEPLAIQTDRLPPGSQLQPYRHTIEVTGGVPGYHFALTSGSLPSGLFLDSFTGTISGVPGQAGVFPVTLQLQDNDRTSPAVSKPFLLIVTPVEHAASQTDPGKIGTASDTLVRGGSYSVKR